jgi:hypothetical protein
VNEGPQQRTGGGVPSLVPAVSRPSRLTPDFLVLSTGTLVPGVIGPACERSWRERKVDSTGRLQRILSSEGPLRGSTLIAQTFVTVLLGGWIAVSAPQTPTVRAVDEKVLREYTGANHSQFEAKVGSNAEPSTLQRFVPTYFTTIQDWLAKRTRGFRASP